MDFNGKVGIVTGGAAGIGLAVAEGFLKGGGKAVLVDRDSSVADAAKRLGALGVVISKANGSASSLISSSAARAQAKHCKI